VAETFDSVGVRSRLYIMARKQGMQPLVLQGHERPLTCLKFTRDGELMFSSGLDGNVCCWRLPDGQRMGTYQVNELNLDSNVNEPLPAVFGIDPNHEGDMLLVGTADNYAAIFDVYTGDVIDQLETEGPVQAVEWCRNPVQDKFVVTVRTLESAKSHYIAVYQREAGAKKGANIHELCRIEAKAHNVGLPRKVYWGPYDKTLITTHDASESGQGFFCVWDAFSGEKITQKECHATPISSISFDNDRSIAMTTSRDKYAKIWNVATGWNLICELKSEAPLNGGALSPLISERSKSRMYCKETLLSKGREEIDFEFPLRPHAVIGGGQAASDVTTTGSSEGKFEAQLWNVPLGHKIGDLGGHIGPINYVAFFPNGRGFATGGEDGFIRLTDFDEEYFILPEKCP